MTASHLSIFDMLKIGVGPSSSHTMGPWRAASRFLSELSSQQRGEIVRLTADLYGSLAKTGKGHGTDTAVLMGLCGEQPETIDTATIFPRIEQIETSKRLPLLGEREIPFSPRTDIRFHHDRQLAFHPNGLRFKARLAGGDSCEASFFSIGGGFIVRENEPPCELKTAPPFPARTADELLKHCETQSISQTVLQNELAWQSEEEVFAQLDALQNAMFDSIHRGCLCCGELPGGLGVQRRAAGIAKQRLGAEPSAERERWMEAIQTQPRDFQNILEWVSCFALAVNEENAAFGRIVTAPTNGAAGVIPAVLMYCACFLEADQHACRHFLLTAGQVGALFKIGATISAAMGGCQAEIGVSSAMAAAALAEFLGGSPGQALEAAEIAMEHHLGMTCDPIGGLVQIPCIERNAMGAVKAITAAQMALQRSSREARVSLDAVIRTMWETAQDMHQKYKETSEGGLAVQIPVNVSEC